MTHVTPWTDLEDGTLSEKSWRQRGILWHSTPARRKEGINCDTPYTMEEP